MEIVSNLKIMLKNLSESQTSVKASALNGSYAVNRQTRTSDIDFVILVDTEQDINRIESKLKKILAFEKYFHEVPHFRYNEYEVCICIYSIEWYRSIAENLFSSKSHLLQWQPFIQHKLVETLPVYDPDSNLENMKALVSLYPDNLAEAVRDESLKYLENEYIHDWGFKNNYHFAFSLQDILNHIALAFYASIKKLYMPPLKRFQDDLINFNPKLNTLLSEFTKIKDSLSFDMKKETLIKAIKNLREIKFPTR